jgi:hypothetical protein
MASLQRGNLPFDAQAAVFADDQFVNETWDKTWRRRRLKSCNEGQAYVEWIAM